MELKSGIRFPAQNYKEKCIKNEEAYTEVSD